MGAFDFLFGNEDSTQSPGDVSASAGYAPATPISIVSSGKGTNITPTVNVVTTSNIDLGLGGNEGFVLSNSNVNGSIVVSDMGAIDASYRAIEGATGGAFQFADVQAGRAYDAIGGAYTGALQFADAQTGRAFDAVEGATSGAFRLIDEALDANNALVGAYGDLVEYNNQQWISQFENVQENFRGVVGGLGNTLSNVIGRLGEQSTEALAFVQQGNAQLQAATVGAINTVALKNQSSEAQAFDKLQDTLVKLGAGLAVVLVVAAVMVKK